MTCLEFDCFLLSLLSFYLRNWRIWAFGWQFAQNYLSFIDQPGKHMEELEHVLEALLRWLL